MAEARAAGPHGAGGEAWAAVLRRDRTFDGLVYYGVESTGVFCRPSCPSRRPTRSRVRFFASAAEASRAGYRACLRCRPEEATAPSPGARAVERVRAHLEAHPEEPVRLAQLARLAGVSPFHLQRTFRRALGVSPAQYLAALRLRTFKRALRRGEDVTASVYAAGYGSSSRLYERAAARLGMSPGRYRAGGAGMRIRYLVERTPIGLLLVGTTDRGVSAVALGDEADPLEASLRAEYPRATLERVEGPSDAWARSVLAHARGGPIPADLPLDVRATAFQARVWSELRRIPPGETRSYGEIARRIGAPGSARAVARACASNPAALVVPCHRVVRADGRLGGYRWGLGRKRSLLAREAARGGRPRASAGSRRAR
jgi:AraC family transcriptional regulator of adaptative response/methylated-DNA-[protein]-cysteine methyltransferase